MSVKSSIYPFSAIVSQEDMKLALLLNAVDLRVGGLLIRGQKGTAKSTAVRALSSLLPDTPLVNLPLNVTEEMVTGGLDLEFALKSGKHKFQPGLLAKVDGGILYVDEVNLLDDHIIDVIMDAASSGVNIIEREGISYQHPSRFILVGTMNPEEGELRPHFLDRFGLCVDISSEEDIEKRVLLMERREQYDTNPERFKELYTEDEEEVTQRISQAKQNLHKVSFPEHLNSFISEICMQNNAAGHRADITIKYAAKALASYDSRFEVNTDDIKKVAEMALIHRRRDAMPEPPPPEPKGKDEESSQDEQNGDLNLAQPEADNGEDHENKPDNNLSEFHIELPETDEEEDGNEGGGNDDQTFDIGNAFRVRRISQKKDRLIRRGSGRRSRTRTLREGRYIKSTFTKNGNMDIAFDATIRAAAPEQKFRQKPEGLLIAIREQDIREKLRERRIGNFLLFIVDVSGSMGARARMVATKGAILSLLMDAYQKRDKVGLITFRRKGAEVNLQPTSSIDLAFRHLEEMPVGGRTPISHGLVEGFRLLKNHLLKEPAARPIAIIITDGKANVSYEEGKLPHEEALVIANKMSLEKRVRYIVVDTEEKGVISFGLALKIAIELDAEYFRIEDLKSDDLIDIVRKESQI
jgi:magnesium chelatase subunit D